MAIIPKYAGRPKGVVENSTVAAAHHRKRERGPDGNLHLIEKNAAPEAAVCSGVHMSAVRLGAGCID
jgi:hypothetical protein